MAKLIESLTRPLAGLFIVIICTGLVQIASGGRGEDWVIAPSSNPSKPPIARGNYAVAYTPTIFRHLTKCVPKCDNGEPQKSYCEQTILGSFLSKERELANYFGSQLEGTGFPKFNYNTFVSTYDDTFFVRCIWLNGTFPKLVNSKDERVAAWSQIRASCMDYIKEHCESVHEQFEKGQNSSLLSNRLHLQVELCYDAKLCE